jgi:glycosyltransferase involved in cell wall biosynthesis
MVIKRAINSIMEQTLLPNEIILVDDCSTDNTHDALASLLILEHINVQIIALEKNSGPAHARNIGIDLANNELIAFLDADDSWHPRKIEFQYELMINSPDVMLSGHVICLYPSTINEATPKILCTSDISFKKLLFKNYFNTPSVIIRKSNLRFPDEMRYAEDFAFWLAISNTGARLVIINFPLGYVHKPFYGHSGLSQNLKIMHYGEVNALMRFIENSQTSKMIVFLALIFSKFKYTIRNLLILIPRR